MRKGNGQMVGDVINQLIDSYKLRDKLNEVKLARAWEAVMGEAIARRTKRIAIRNRVMTVEVTSAPLKQELFTSRERIKTIFNEELGGAYIEEVKIR